MDLGELIAVLEAEDPRKVCPVGFTNPHSYRGFYHEIAFEPAYGVSVGSMLDDAKSSLGKLFPGYKGDHYLMQEYTACWLSPEGEANGETLGPILLGLMLRAGCVLEGDV